MIIQQQTQYKILLIGDNCIDVYQYGSVDRISPEAPVPVFKFSHEESRPGMAGNVYNNLVALGCNVYAVYGETSTKTRLIDTRSKQQIVRIDNDVHSSSAVITYKLDNYDAIVISDYNKGTVSYELIESLRKDYRGPIFVDTKKTDLARLEGCIVKINSLEFSQIKTRCSNMIVTLGAAGADWDNEIFLAPKVEVSDVCGAGDTFLAALAYWYIHSKDMEQSVKFAIKSSAVTVQHLGVYAPSLEEIL
jgi:D-beta-D-heptose 7-phosphate kinase/D-beta-D-heptose 1-phosphate adenosyltransferase